jgi:hypothetical protein
MPLNVYVHTKFLMNRQGKKMQGELIIPEHWSVQGIKYHHSFFYWTSWMVYIVNAAMPGVDAVPPYADVTYTLRRTADGRTETFRLRGDNAPDALLKKIEALDKV